MGKFVFENDYEKLLKVCGGDEDLAMDMVVSILESKQKHRYRSLNMELSAIKRVKAKSKDIMDREDIESLTNISNDNRFCVYDAVDEGLLYELLFAISSLNHREQCVIYYRFFNSYTLEQVGKIFDVSRDRIRQIEAKALRKLRHPSRCKFLKDYIYPKLEKDGIKNLSMSISSIEDFFELMDKAERYEKTKKKSPKKTLLEIAEEKQIYEFSVITDYCKDIEDYLISGEAKVASNTAEDPSQIEYDKTIKIREDIFTDLDEFVNSLGITPMPYILKRSIKLALLEVYDRCTVSLDNASGIIRLLYYHDSDYYGDYMTLKEAIRLIAQFTQRYKTRLKSFNKKDGGWIEYYDYRWNNYFSDDSISFYNMPEEMHHIITIPAYVEWYKEKGPVFSDLDDLVLYSLYNDMDDISYEYKSLINYIRNKYYGGLRIPSFNIYDDERNNQIDLNQLYWELDQNYARDYFKFPIVHKRAKLTAEEVEKNAWNYINIEGPAVLHKSIYPRTYTRTAMLGYYRSMLFLHSIKYTNLESKFGIPIEYISKNSCSFDIEDKKKIAIIASVFIWAYNNIFIKFYVDDFWLLYNSQNFENKIDNLISVINNAMKNMYNKEVLNDTIKIINSIFQK